MAFASLLRKNSLRFAAELQCFFVEPTLADARAISDFAEVHKDHADYGLIAAACVIAHWSGDAAPTEDEWPDLDGPDAVLARAKTLKDLPARYASKVAAEVTRLFGDDPSDQD